MATSEMRDGGDGRKRKREETVAAKRGRKDVGHQGHLQWRDGKAKTAAAKTWYGKKRYGGQWRWRFWVSMMAPVHFEEYGKRLRRGNDKDRSSRDTR